MFPMWAFQSENQAHNTHFSETEFQLITIPSSNRDTESDEVLYGITRMALYGQNDVLMSAHLTLCSRIYEKICS